MKGREAKGGAPSTDLLVCFPSRAHLTLMPKPICSPARPSEPSKRHHGLHRSRHFHHHRRKKAGVGTGAGSASPLLWSKAKAMGSEISEPTSPKVTCAGQIKVRPKARSCKNWQSVMEEIERIHNHRKEKKRPSWVETLGLKKDIMQFLTCLRSIRFDFQCFRAFPESDITTDDEEDGEEEEEEDEAETGIRRTRDETHESTRTVFSKWFMVLQENHNDGFHRKKTEQRSPQFDASSMATPSAPPPNALLLMRCRSAPAKSWPEEEESEDGQTDKRENKAKKTKSLKSLMEEEKRNKSESLVKLKPGSPDFFPSPLDVVKETWVVGGLNRDPLSRSRSWKRW